MTEKVDILRPTPTPSATPVVHIADMAGLFTPAQRADLTKRLGALQARTGRPVVVATVKSLNGRDLDAAVNDLGNRLGAHDGVLLFISTGDREVRLAIGEPSRGLLTDVEAKRIVSETMYPDLHANRFAAGMLKGVDRIIAELSETRG